MPTTLNNNTQATATSEALLTFAKWPIDLHCHDSKPGMPLALQKSCQCDTLKAERLRQQLTASITWMTQLTCKCQSGSAVTPMLIVFPGLHRARRPVLSRFILVSPPCITPHVNDKFVPFPRAVDYGPRRPPSQDNGISTGWRAYHQPIMLPSDSSQNGRQQPSQPDTDVA